MTALLLTALLWHASLPTGAMLAQTGPGAAPPQQQPSAVSPPFQPEVSDPLLEPVPPAPVQVGSWDEALTLLRQQSTDLRVALARVESATGLRRVALAGLLPTVNGSAGVQSNVLDPSTPFIGGGVGGGGIGGGVGAGGGDGPRPTTPLGTATVTASVPLLNWSALQSLRSASASRRAAELSVEETRRQLTGELARALARVASSERLSEVNRVNLRSALERLALAQRRLELGAGTQLDVIRLRQDAESARSSVVSGDNSLLQARDALALILGQEQPVGLTRGVSLEELLNRGQAQCQNLQELEKRPDLAAAHAQLEAAGHDVSAAEAQYLPTLAAQSTVLGFTVDPGFARVPVWNVGAVLTLPFYEGGARGGRVRQARAQEETARQDVVSRQRGATVEVRQTRREVGVAGAELEIATRARELAAENDRLTRRAFEVGTGTSQDLVVSAAALRQAELNLVVSEFQLFQARIEAFLAEAACDW